MLELCEKNTNIKSLSLSLSLTQEKKNSDSKFCVSEVGDGDGWYYLHGWHGIWMDDETW